MQSREPCDPETTKAVCWSLSTIMNWRLEQKPLVAYLAALHIELLKIKAFFFKAENTPSAGSQKGLFNLEIHCATEVEESE